MKGEFEKLQYISRLHQVVSLSLFYTKYDKDDLFKLNAQVWLQVDVWWSKDGHYDRLLTNI